MIIPQQASEGSGEDWLPAFRHFSLALAPLTKAVPMALGWQRNVTALPGHRELAAAAGIMLEFFGQRTVGVIHSVPYTRLWQCPLPKLWLCPVWAGGSWKLRGRAHIAEALQPRMWAKLHLLNKTLQFSRRSQSYWCGNSLKKPVGSLSGGCGLVQHKHCFGTGKPRSNCQAWPPSLPVPPAVVGRSPAAEQLGPPLQRQAEPGAGQ